MLAEHRLERCLPAADRVSSCVDGRIVADETAARWLDSGARDAASRTPAARPFALARRGRRAPVAVEAGARGVRRGAAGAGGAGGVGGRGASARRAGATRCGEAARRRAARPRRARREAAALAVEDVWVELRDGPAVLQGVTLHARAGEAIALMGRNGAGKSTLLKAIAGLLEPTRGQSGPARPRCSPSTPAII